MKLSFEWRPSLEQLEHYAMSQSNGAALEQTEEHLLVCEDCRCRLDAVEQEIRVLRIVLRQSAAKASAASH